ncbi:uncharacterized protein LOC120067877 [Benincasa hispida]|uniref:uncharacterized protein LOC120067877 n=1 Tax=Benincasa hispida TaxID=102211 RepID=UPI001900CC6B|nr:uncharacterized protein LOC120067877 [Benincasa hispida]
MRIRKNAKLSPLLFSAVESVPEVLQTHICQLNQSPWDVIPLHQHDTNQVEEAEDSFNENASLDDSIGAVESVASMMEESAKLSNNNIAITNGNEVMADKDGDYREDLNENGDGFEKLVDSSLKCKKQFKEEDYSSFSSDHHDRRSFLRSSENNYYSTLNNCSIAKKSAAGGTVSRRMRPARSSKKTVSVAAGGSNPYEFYYYSGFGPLWGKKRRERGGEEDSGKSSENTTGIRSNATTPSPSDVEELDYMEDDDDEEEENGDGDGGKKRMRKPVKARSLKSLM